jgi:hypothetical protein
MARFYGAVGYIEYQETAIDVVSEVASERMYKGELLKNNRKLVGNDNINDNVTITNQVSILADPYALNHIYAIRYVNWMGTNWKVDNIEVQSPRLILSLGGVYNGKTA